MMKVVSRWYARCDECGKEYKLGGQKDKYKLAVFLARDNWFITSDDKAYCPVCAAKFKKNGNIKKEKNARIWTGTEKGNHDN